MVYGWKQFVAMSDISEIIKLVKWENTCPPVTSSLKFSYTCAAVAPLLVGWNRLSCPFVKLRLRFIFVPPLTRYSIYTHLAVY